MSELKGKVVLVTGGGRGLGEQICYTLAEAGAITVPADVRKDLADKVALAIQVDGGKSLPLRLDVVDQDQAEDAVNATLTEFGRLDVLVNNAAIDVTLPIEDMTLSDWDRILAVNLRGPFAMSKYALQAMKRQQGGHIVNMVSTASKRAWENASAYHASKWGLLGLSHALFTEARKDRVKVTAVVAGGMRTPFLLDRFPNIDQANLQDPRNVAETVRFVLTQPEDTVIPEVMVIPVKETSWP